jgi:hypothetical protein
MKKIIALAFLALALITGTAAVTMTFIRSIPSRARALAAESQETAMSKIIALLVLGCALLASATPLYADCAGCVTVACTGSYC